MGNPSILAALAIGVTIAACRPAPEAAPLSQEDVAAIQAGAQEFVRAALAGDAAALAAGYAEDAVFMPPNEPAVKGRAAIEQWWGALEVTDLVLNSLEVDGRNGLAYERGSYSITFSVEGVPVPITDAGKYVVVLRKQPDGSWLIAVDIYNSDLALPD